MISATLDVSAYVFVPLYLHNIHLYINSGAIWRHLYSLSLEPNCNWTRLSPGQEEILEYLIGITHKYQLYMHIRFNTAVEEAKRDEATNTWKTRIQRLGNKDAEFGKEYSITSNFLVLGVGQLNIPKYPDIKGLDSFRGKVMHSARWDWDYDISDKRIGVIGNGATAALFVPEVTKACKSLNVFQRTPNWVNPRAYTPITPTQQVIPKYVPFARRRFRAALMDFRESFSNAIFTVESPVHEFMMKAGNDHIAAQLPGEKYAKLRE